MVGRLHAQNTYYVNSTELTSKSNLKTNQIRTQTKENERKIEKKSKWKSNGLKTNENHKKYDNRMLM